MPQTNEIERNLTGLDDTPVPPWIGNGAISAVAELEPPPFSDDEYADRLRKVRQAMANAGLAALLVFRPSSVEYLCGYHSAETAPQPLLLTHDDTYLFVPDLEIGRSLTSSRARNLVYYGYAQTHRALSLVAEHVARTLGDERAVGVEFEHTSTPPHIIELLRDNDVAVLPGGNLVERVRLVLSREEIRCVERAASSTRRGVEAAVRAAREADATDSSVAAAIAGALLRDATSPSAWGPVVATGKRGGIPHSSWKNNPLGPATTFLEFAGAHHRYHAPVMRTLSRGRPSPADQRLCELSQAALGAVLGTARAGMPCSEVAHQAKEAIGQLPDDVVFHQLYGYPVGLAHPPHWMDGAPFHITLDNREPLREGMVFHMPGSFRSFGNAGVGFSQTFLIETNGVRVLTEGPAELIEI